MLKFTETGEQSGFWATGIYPLDRNQILKKLPGTDDTESNESFGNSLNDTVIQFLQGIRNKKAARTQRKKKINIAPGKSIGLEDFEIGESSGCSVPPTKNKKKSAKKLNSDSSDYELELQDESNCGFKIFYDEMHQENEEDREANRGCSRQRLCAREIRNQKDLEIFRWSYKRRTA